ncbi:MAG: hypothetical protein ABIT09_07520 [Croceibacterium sp.]
MTIPPLGPDGVRVTPNKNLNADETLWYLRSGWNVAALNCLDPAYEPILEGYRGFLKKYVKKLASTNAALDAQYRKANGSAKAGIKAREVRMTQVYNYFALPPARTEFCGAVLGIASEFLASPPADPVPLAAASLARIDAAFEKFFTEYDQYRVDSAAWDTRYGAQYGYSQPGYVAVHSLSGPRIVAPEATLPVTSSAVTDPDTGARIPVIPAPVGTISTPVVQPVPSTQRR